MKNISPSDTPIEPNVPSFESLIEKFTIPKDEEELIKVLTKEMDEGLKDMLGNTKDQIGRIHLCALVGCLASKFAIGLSKLYFLKEDQKNENNQKEQEDKTEE